MALKQHPFVTLTGLGGMGKSRLAISVAEKMGPNFADGVRYFNLSNLPTGTPVEDVVLRSMVGTDVSTARAGERLVDYLRNREQLIVLDNCEHVSDEVLELVSSILDAAGGVRILATSRHVFGSFRERIITVPPLGVPKTASIPDRQQVAASESVKLLSERARSVQPGFSITSDNYRTAARICELLEGNPLAIELAASRLRTFSLADIEERLEDRFSFLTSPDATMPPRHRSLRALIDWSWELCTPSERLLWQRASVFSGGFTLEAIEQVCSGSDLNPKNAWELLDQLVLKSIVIPESSGQSLRYRFLDSIAEFGSQQLKDTGESETIQRAHRDYFAQRAQASCENWSSSQQGEIIAMLREERANMARSLEWSFDTEGEALRGAVMVNHLRFHWAVDGYLRDGRKWTSLALAANPDPGAVRGTTLWVAAWILLLQGETETARRLLAESVFIANQSSDPDLKAYVSLFRGTAALWTSELENAVTLLKSAVTHFMATEKSFGMLFGSMMFVLALADTGEFDRAQKVADRAMEKGREIGDQWGTCQVEWASGLVSWLDGDLTGAVELVRAGLSRRLDFDRVGTALQFDVLAWIMECSGDHDEAARLLGVARDLWRALGTSIHAFGTSLAQRSEQCHDALEGHLSADRRNALMLEGARWDPVVRTSRALGIAHSRQDEKSTGSEVLTPTEWTISQLLADGLSNREIATRLVISHRTVEGHVANALMKLGFTSRSQIATWVALGAQALPSGESNR
ncbi:ATP-binding protein [Citricoccus sp. NR2]|uniref:ATP-binding protein n=1 Tax=Citricoccus sp. NR2 TaxID=3004095 RepID=UPI0022DE3223|nr:LuxR C-terminal-related transcriptional regulator [Citricoccus sp. NR2]WBL19218.1 LuxR C-terminal-related transcriptional regulator [Citricoccus sp. NR2]